MDPNSIKTMAAAAGAGGDDLVYVEDVFSTFLYEGNDGTNTINNGIDLDGEGGMVWIKRRDGVTEHVLTDTERGAGKVVYSDQAWGEGTGTNGVNVFNNNGFSLTGTDGQNNGDGNDYASWSFRKAPGFFDIVKFEGEADTGTSPRAIAHNLGCKPGCIFFRNLDSSLAWVVYHKGLSDPSDVALTLNENWAEENALYFGDTDPTSTHFYVGDHDGTNKNGDNIIAYLFADGDDSDAQIFGDDEDESIIKMGTFTTDASQNATVTGLGWEPQWVLFKRTSTTGDWRLHDNIRNLAHNGYALLRVNTDEAEASHATVTVISATPDGFEIQNTNASSTYAYIAIRRGPMKIPDDATKVFAIDTGNASATIPAFDSGFPVDFALRHSTSTSGNNSLAFSRLQGVGFLYTRLNSTEFTGTTTWDSNVGYDEGTGLTSTYIAHMFRRAPGFFDALCFDGTGSAQTVNHNLGVVPEMMITKCRSSAHSWAVYHTGYGVGRFGRLNSDASYNSTTMWNNTAPTASVFSVGANDESNKSSGTMIAYLFASLAGISKVGTYNGDSDSTIPVDCGFSAGARFVLIKREDTDGSWFLFDSTRGITTGGNDPYMSLNTGDAQVTTYDRLDANTSGFTVKANSDAGSDLNVDGGTYIYLAIA